MFAFETILEQQLDEFIDQQQPTHQHFAIDSLDKAEWAVRKISGYHRKIDEAEKLAETRIAQIQAWLGGVRTENEQQILFFEQLLRPFAETQLEGAKKRSLKLPGGTVGFRKSQPKFTRDEDKLLAWAKEAAPDMVIVTECVHWGELKKALQVVGDKAISDQGEIIPGLAVEQQPDAFYVKAEER